MKCKRCGREIKSIKSIERGYGENCWKQLQLSNNKGLSQWFND